MITQSSPFRTVINMFENRFNVVMSMYFVVKAGGIINIVTRQIRKLFVLIKTQTLTSQW